MTIGTHIDDDSNSTTTEAMQQAFLRASARATLAPSIHNSQPWKFVVGPHSLSVFVDPSRAAPVIDPVGRQRTMSCGAALFLALTSLAAEGYQTVLTLRPEHSDPTLLATVVVQGPPSTPDEGAIRLDAAVEDRHSNRRQFAPTLLPEAVVQQLREAARSQGAILHEVAEQHDRVVTSALAQHADAIENADASYRSELRAWTTIDPSRRDGVAAVDVPHVTGQAHDDIPMRDFDTAGMGALPPQTRSRLRQTLLVLATRGDGIGDWIDAGQALASVLLTATAEGYVASVFSQVIEVPGTREELRRALRMSSAPQLLLRIGTAVRTSASARLPMHEVVSVRPAPAASAI